MGKRKKQQRASPDTTETKPRGRPRKGDARWPFWVAAGMLALVVWIVYRQALDAPLFFDDYSSIVRNESIVALWPLVGDDINPGPLNPPPFIPTAARPVVNLSFALNYAAGKLDPAGYRAVNTTLHMLSAMLLGAIVLRTLRLPQFSVEDTSATWLALAVAFLWAVHPLQTESVIYVTQRTELMMAFFYLATLYCSQRYWASSEKAARSAWLATAVLACGMGMMSKEVMVSAPLVVLLYERTFVAHSLRSAIRNSWPLYLGLFSTWTFLVFLHRGNPHGEAAGFSTDVSLLTWWLTQAKVALMYFELAFWPWPLQIHYDVPYLNTVADAWPYLFAIAIPGLATLVMLWRNHPIGFLVTCVFVVLSPTSLVPIITEAAAERRMYLPLAAIVALAVVGGYWLAGCLSTRRAPLMAVGIPMVVVGVAMTGISAERVATYQSPMGLWLDVVERQPKNPLAYQNVGSELLRAGRASEAAEWYQRALRIDPDIAQAHYNLGLIFIQSNQFDRAITEFRQTARLEPDVAEHRNSLGAAFFQAKRYDEAIPHFREAFELDPQNWLAHLNLGTTLVMTHQLAEAVTQYELALKINPKALNAYIHLADALARLNRPTEAVAVAERGLEVARADGNQEIAARIAAHLADYRAMLASPRGQARPDAASTPPSN